MKNILIFLVVLFSVSSCSDSNSSGSSIGATALRPPVESATPTSLKGSGSGQAFIFKKLGFLINRAHANGTVEVTALKDYIFSSTGDGPLHFLNTISQVDKRMESLDARAIEFQRRCLTEEAKLFTYPASFRFVHDEAYSFDMYLQCQESINEGDDEIRIGFGIKESKLYLMELQTSSTNFNGAVLATTDLVSEETEIWILSANNSDESSSFLYIKSVKDVGVQFSIGGHTQNNATTCGLVMAASDSDDRINLSGIFADSMNAGDCTGTNPAPVNFCIRSTDLAQAEVDCGSIDSVSITSIPDLNYTTIFNTSPPSGVTTLGEYNTYAKSLIDDLVDNADFSGLTDFNEGVEEE